MDTNTSAIAPGQRRPDVRRSIGELGRLALLVALYNAPFWLLARWMFIDRAVLDVDFFVAVLLARIHPVLGFVTTFVAFALDMTVSQSLTYHFTTPWDFFRSVAFVGALNWRDWVASIHWLSVVPFLVCGLALWRLMRRPVDWRITLAVTLSLIGIDSLNGSSLLSWHDRRITVNVAGSPSATLLYQAFQPTQARSIRPSDDPQVRHFHEQLAGWAARNPQGSVLVILVESMGQPKSPLLRTWLQDRLNGGSGEEASHRLETGANHFRGATTAGELRTLCGMAGNYRALTQASGSACLPVRLQQQGWNAVGLHGFTRRMFERDTWWPLMGLSRRLFAEDLLPALQECGATFKGVCDRSLIQAAVQEAQAPRTFVYALTLGTHLPVPSTTVDARLQALCTQAMVEMDVCQLQSLVGQVLDAISMELRASPRPLAVLVAGDHAPPFGSLKARQAYEPDQVPVFLLLPKE
jgi:hypothetical protein